MPGLLNISEAMSIALHTCAYLADNAEGFSSVRVIAGKLGFSANHSTKVVQQLVRAGILATVRGHSGGARLARPADEITLLEIYEAAGGTPRYKGCLLKSNVCDGRSCALGKLMVRENERLAGLLGSTSLDSVVRSLKRNRKHKEKKQ